MSRAPARSRSSQQHLLHRGPGLLDDLELIGLVLGVSDRRRGARLLQALGGLAGLGRAGPERLEAHLSAAEAVRLRAACELGRRALDAPLERGASIASAEDVYRRLRARLVPLEQEQLHVLGLDTLNRVMIHFVACVGTINQVYASPRDVFRPLVREGSHSAIVVHNHPSGACAPSAADAELTRRLAEAGAVVGVVLLDHVVIARDGRYSFAEHGALGANGAAVTRTSAEILDTRSRSATITSLSEENE